jgi:lipid A ethanolaminephosphotransferase
LLPLVYFPDASSCGTATSASLPCMFAVQDQEHFDRQLSKHQDNLLDIAARAGYDVYWRDNGNSCKSICARVDSRDLHDSEIASLCSEGECYDEILVHELALLLPEIKKDTLIVLHQLGSHGPAYFRRYPESFRVFTPDCRSTDLGDCTGPEIVNAYDNTILYTDHVLAEAIELLTSYDDRLDASLMYVSDHGESLGEHGLYLHGMPYGLAPVEQTRVPMLAWLSPSLKARRGMADVCDVTQSRRAVSHDNLFFTELGLLEIDTSLYVAAKDVFADYCQEPTYASDSI